MISRSNKLVLAGLGIAALVASIVYRAEAQVTDTKFKFKSFFSTTVTDNVGGGETAFALPTIPTNGRLIITDFLFSNGSGNTAGARINVNGSPTIDAIYCPNNSSVSVNLTTGIELTAGETLSLEAGTAGLTGNMSANIIGYIAK